MRSLASSCGSLRGGRSNASTVIALVFTVVVLYSCFKVLGGDGDKVQNEVRARTFTVIDDAGRKRAEFGVLPDGRVGLVTWDETKSVAAWIGVDADGMPVVSVGSADGKPLAEIGMLDKRSAVLVMRAANGERRLGMAVTETGAAGIGLYDAAKMNRCMINLGDDGHPQLTLKDSKGVVRSRIMVESNGTCALDLLDAEGRARVVAQVDREGEPGLVIFGPKGEAVWSASGPQLAQPRIDPSSRKLDGL